MFFTIIPVQIKKRKICYYIVIIKCIKSGFHAVDTRNQGQLKLNMKHILSAEFPFISDCIRTMGPPVPSNRIVLTYRFSNDINALGNDYNPERANYSKYEDV